MAQNIENQPTMKPMVNAAEGSPELKDKQQNGSVSALSLLSLGAGLTGVVLGIVSVLEAMPILLGLGVVAGAVGVAARVAESVSAHDHLK